MVPAALPQPLAGLLGEPAARAPRRRAVAPPPPQPGARLRAQERWRYLEHDWTATAGDFVYESPGEGHTLVSYESDEPMRVFFNVEGPLMWLDEDGNTTDYFDVHHYIEMCKEHYDKVGIGADYIEQLFR